MKETIFTFVPSCLYYDTKKKMQIYSDVFYITFVSVSKINMYRIAIFNQQMIPGRESYIL